MANAACAFIGMGGNLIKAITWGNTVTNITTTTNGITIVRIPTSPQLEVIGDEHTRGAVDEYPLTAPLESTAK